MRSKLNAKMKHSVIITYVFGGYVWTLLDLSLLVTWTSKMGVTFTYLFSQRFTARALDVTLSLILIDRFVSRTTLISWVNENGEWQDLVATRVRAVSGRVGNKQECSNVSQVSDSTLSTAVTLNPHLLSMYIHPSHPPIYLSEKYFMK